MHNDPIDPPTPAASNPAQPARVVVTTVYADGTVDVRMVSSRGAKSRVPHVAGLTLAAGDRAVLQHFDGDRNTPIITHKL